MTSASNSRVMHRWPDIPQTGTQRAVPILLSPPQLVTTDNRSVMRKERGPSELDRRIGVSGRLSFDLHTRTLTATNILIASAVTAVAASLENIDQLQFALRQFKEDYDGGWLIQCLNFRTLFAGPA